MKRNQKKIRKRYLRVNKHGQILYAGFEEATDYGNEIEKDKAEVLFSCPSCDQPLEKNRVRSSCPLCGVCCDFCHNARWEHEEVLFKRFVLLEQARREYWEPIYDKLPLGRWLKRIAAWNSASRLADMQRRLLYERRNAQRRLPPGR